MVGGSVTEGRGESEAPSQRGTEGQQGGWWYSTECGCKANAPPRTVKSKRKGRARVARPLSET